MKIKMTDKHFQDLSVSINDTVAKFSLAAVSYQNTGFSHMRYRWDILHASKHDMKYLYQYLDDSHIDTALRKILGNDW